MSAPKLRLAFFARVSTDAQKSEDTVQRQLVNFKADWPRLAETYELLPRAPGSLDECRYFIDEAYNLEEIESDTALADLLGRISNGEVQALYVSEGDRLYRSNSLRVRGTILDLIRKHDIKVFTKGCAELPQDPLLQEIMSSIGAQEKRAILTKLQEAKIQRTRDEGRPPAGKVPFGYDWHKQKKEWSVVSEERKILRCIYGLAVGKADPEMPPSLAELALASKGGLTGNQIADALNASGLSLRNNYLRNHFRQWLAKNPEGKFSGPKVSKLIQDERYCGSWTVHYKPPHRVGYGELDLSRKLQVVISLPPIFTKEEWSELKSVRLERQAKRKDNTRHEYLLRGILTCDLCGAKMSARTRSQEKYFRRERRLKTYRTPYYVDWRHVRADGSRCSATTCHNATMLDELIWSETEKIVLDPRTIQSLASSQSEIQPAPSVAALKKDLQDHERRISELEQERTNVTTFLVKGLLTESDALQQRERIEKDRNALAKLKRRLATRIATLEREQAGTEIDLPVLQEKFRHRLDQLDFEERSFIVNALLKEIRIQPDGGLRIFLNPIRSLERSAHEDALARTA